jgi:hypothetical protein
MSDLIPPAPPTSTTGPVGETRSIGKSILLFVVTLGVYSLYWIYKSHEEIKQHSGVGVGGVVGLVIWIVVPFVTWFELPSEVGKMYNLDGRKAPMTGWAGLWNLLLVIGTIIWWFKIQTALNRYWENKGATPA